MSIEYTIEVSGRIPLPYDRLVQFRIKAAAERPREAVDRVGERAGFARKALRDTLKAAKPDLTRGLKGQAGHPWVRLEDWGRAAAQWRSLVDLDGRHVPPGVVTDELRPGIGGAIDFRVDPVRAAAVMVGHGWEFEIYATPAPPSGAPAGKESPAATPGRPSKFPVADALGGLRALGLGLEQGLPDIGGLWRVFRLLPPVGVAITVPLPARGIRVKLFCGIVPYREELLRIGPHVYDRGFDPRTLIESARSEPSPIEQVLARERVQPDSTWQAFVGGASSYLEPLASAHWRWGINRAAWWERLLLATIGVWRDLDLSGHGPAANVRALAFRAHLLAGFRDAWPAGLMRVIRRTDPRPLRWALRTWPTELIFVFRDSGLAREVERSAGCLRLLGLRPQIVDWEEREGLVCVWLWPGFRRRGEHVLPPRPI